MARTLLGPFVVGPLFCRWEWDSHDLWIGVFTRRWDFTTEGRGTVCHEAWLCLVPCLPLYVCWTRGVR